MGTEITVTIDDIIPFRDMILDYTETIDQLEGPAALVALQAFEQIQAAINQAMSFLKTQALEVLDGQPMQIGHTVYAKAPKLVKRANHSRVKTMIAMRAITDQGKAVDDPREAAMRAVDITYDLFLSESSVPKVTVLRKLGIADETLVGKELTGYEIKATKLASDD